jgi:hypothetical protein
MSSIVRTMASSSSSGVRYADCINCFRREPNRKKSHGARSGEYGGWTSRTNPYSANFSATPWHCAPVHYRNGASKEWEGNYSIRGLNHRLIDLIETEAGVSFLKPISFVTAHRFRQSLKHKWTLLQSLAGEFVFWDLDGCWLWYGKWLSRRVALNASYNLTKTSLPLFEKSPNSSGYRIENESESGIMSFSRRTEREWRSKDNESS